MKHETRQLAQAAKEQAPSHCRPHCWAGGNTCLYCGKVKRQKAKKLKIQQAITEAIHVAAGGGEGI